MKQSADLIDLQERLGYRFSDPSLLRQALTHSSMSGPGRDDNQRMEFLGDRVLGLVMADALYNADGKATEGQMAPRFNQLVRKETCADVARQIDLGAALKLGRSEQMSGGRRKMALLGDAMEAVLAAVYQDGGFDAARRVILHFWEPRIDQVEDNAKDAKTRLQEWAQARAQQPPKYTVVRREGPDHAPVFTIEVMVTSGETAQATAPNKRQAEQEAAKRLLTRMDEG